MQLSAVIEAADNELPGVARLALQQAHLHWVQLDTHLVWCDERIAQHAREDERVRKAQALSGVGPVTASAVVASVGDCCQFASARQFSAWLGMAPRQNSSGGKTNLGGITKRGDEYLRTLLIQAAKSAVLTAHKRSDRISQWVLQLRQRAGWQKAAVALAAKNARILWAVLSRGERFDAQHVPSKPHGSMPSASPA